MLFLQSPFRLIDIIQIILSNCCTKRQAPPSTEMAVALRPDNRTIVKGKAVAVVNINIIINNIVNIILTTVMIDIHLPTFTFVMDTTKTTTKTIIRISLPIFPVQTRIQIRTINNNMPMPVSVTVSISVLLLLLLLPLLIVVLDPTFRFERHVFYLRPCVILRRLTL